MSEPKNLVIKVKRTTPDLSSEAPPQMIREWNFKRIAGALIALLVLIGLWSLWLSKPDKINVPGQSVTTKTGALPPSTHAIAPTPPPPAAAPTSDAPPMPIPAPTPPPAAPPTLDTPPAAVPSSTPTAAAPTVAPAAPDNAAGAPAPVIKTAPNRTPADSAIPDSPAANAKPDDALHVGKVTRATLAYGLIDKEPVNSIKGPITLGNLQTAIYYFTEIQNLKGQPVFHEWWKNGQRIMNHPLAVTSDKWRGDTQRLLNANDAGFWSVRTVDSQGILLNEIAFTIVAR